MCKSNSAIQQHTAILWQTYWLQDNLLSLHRYQAIRYSCNLLIVGFEVWLELSSPSYIPFLSSECERAFYSEIVKDHSHHIQVIFNICNVRARCWGSNNLVPFNTLRVKLTFASLVEHATLEIKSILCWKPVSVYWWAWFF